MKDECIAKLKDLTGKKNVILAHRGSSAIRAALKYAAAQGKTTVLLQDAGGWMSYPKDCQSAKLSVKYITTDDGLIEPDTIRAQGDQNCALLLTSSAGYHALQDMKALAAACREKEIMIINDVSGSIGEPEARVGDVIVSSFGKWKPLDLGKGGFLASNFDVACDEEELNFKELLKKIDNLPQRMSFLYSEVERIKNDLKEHTIIHKDHKGTVAIVAFHGDEEFETLKKYCETHELEFTVCPREIRVLQQALSIEVKRKQYIGQEK